MKKPAILKHYSTEVLIIGAGPAGLSAGIEAAKTGASTLLIDDNANPGGQLVKQTHMFFGSSEELAGTRGFDIAKHLAKEYKKAGGKLMCNTFTLGHHAGGKITAISQGVYTNIHYRRLIVATGAFENIPQFPNNDLPGVYGAGGFQTLMNSQGVLPGENVLMVGAGNIGLIVSYQIMQAGGKVVAVAEARDKIAGYQVHAAKIKRMGVPILLSHVVKNVTGKDKVKKATLVEVDEQFNEIAGSEFSVKCDAVCLATGLSPLCEILTTAGVGMKFIPELKGWVPIHDENQRAVGDIFVAGDVTGIEEASAAMVTGRIAGANAAADLYNHTAEKITDPLKQRLKNLRQGPVSKHIRAGKQKLFSNQYDKQHYSESIKIEQSNCAGDTGLVIECNQPIPCNPCIDSCKRGAITNDGSLIGVPCCDMDNCTGCKKCLISCPGLAMFYIDSKRKDNQVEITIAYETVPIPKLGDVWEAISREGEVLGKAKITAAITHERFDKKYLVSFLVDKKFANQARHVAPVGAVTPLEKLRAKPCKEDTIICRCQDVTESQVLCAIESGHTTLVDLKRVLRIGMGACQGKSCENAVRNILCKTLKRKPSQVEPLTTRTPLKPVPLEVFADAELLEDRYA